MTKNKIPELFIEKILWIQNQIQFNHWVETSGWRHKVLGDFYSDINKLLDELVESIGGIFDKESLYIGIEMYKVESELSNDKLLNDIIVIIETFRKYFTNLNGVIKILDDILTIIHTTSYKLSMT